MFVQRDIIREIGGLSQYTRENWELCRGMGFDFCERLSDLAESGHAIRFFKNMT